MRAHQIWAISQAILWWTAGVAGGKCQLVCNGDHHA